MPSPYPISYCRLSSGKWGLRGVGLVPNQIVDVTKQDGTLRKERVGKILEQLPSGVVIAAISGYYALQCR